MRRVEPPELGNDPAVDLRVRATFRLGQTPVGLVAALAPADAVEPLGHVVVEVVLPDLAGEAEELFDLLELVPRLVDQLVPVDEVELGLGEDGEPAFDEGHVDGLEHGVVPVTES